MKTNWLIAISWYPRPYRVHSWKFSEQFCRKQKRRLLSPSYIHTQQLHCPKQETFDHRKGEVLNPELLNSVGTSLETMSGHIRSWTITMISAMAFIHRSFLDLKSEDEFRAVVMPRCAACLRSAVQLWWRWGRSSMSYGKGSEMPEAKSWSSGSSSCKLPT